MKKNLGSIISSVSEVSPDGYTVNYIEGDVCDIETGRRYSSEMRYVCNSQSDEIGWPDFITKKGKRLFLNFFRRLSLHLRMEKQMGLLLVSSYLGKVNSLRLC